MIDFDDREDYGENRYIGIGLLSGRRVVVVVYTEPDEETVHLISLQKALSYERRRYELNADAMKNTSKTDWDRIDAMGDEDIDTSDIPPLSEEFFAKAQLRRPTLPVKVSVQIDSETFAWFEAQGESAEQQMSAALRIYAEANKAHSVSTAKSV